MKTAYTYLDLAPAINPPVNMTATFVEVVGLDIIIQLLIAITVLLAIITFYTMKRNTRP